MYDSSPAADVDSSAPYRKETSDDGGQTWQHPRPMTGKFLRLDMTDALVADCSVDVQDGGVVVIESPYPMGGLIRYTPAPGTSNNEGEQR
ncbi:hypothetical protein [Streptomyces sp. NPDC056160]|uniref:hypothetical protein n=1 Tax=Streptomyces sp. NPDC056160 TaxID=3345731 RepID=UPI0035E06E6C